MEKLLKVMFIAAIAWMAFTSTSKADDDVYGGIHITVPFSFDAVGVQYIYRSNHVEARMGLDSASRWQLGLGATDGDAEHVVGSGGLAYSSKAHGLVPYIGLRSGKDNTDYGVVSYGADFDTTYVFAGMRFGYNEGDGNAPAYTNRTSDDPVTGGNGSDDSSGPNGPADDDTGDDTGTGGGDVDTGGKGHSGLGDGTNPGKGKGTDRSPNTGTDNPHKVK